MPSRPLPSASTSRWATLLSTIALAAALLGSSASGLLQARRAAEDLVIGQAGQLRLAMAREQRGAVADPAAWLEDFGADWAAQGVLDLAWIEARGEVVAVAGRPEWTPKAAGELASRLRPDAPERAGDATAVLSTFRAGRRGRRGLPRGPRAHRVLVVFDTPAADRLLKGARRTLALSAAGGAGLLFLAVVFWRKSLLAERSAARLARDRHLAALGEMSAVLGHEIRNPLTSLKGHAQLLLRKLPEGDPLAEKAEFVVREAVRLEELTGRILAFSRTAAPDLEAVDPAALLRAVADRLPGEFELRTEEAPPTWPLDRHWMGQALENLARNAQQAAPDGSPVVLGAELVRRQLVLSVTDRGPGIPVELREQIFEPFHTTRVQGTGLGLAIARRVAEQHGGRIEATEPPGGGGCIRIVLEPPA